MRVVQMTLDESLVEEVDHVVEEIGTSRSAFTRDALKEALARRRELDAERRHREGYKRIPVEPSEIHEWEDEQVWPD